MYFKVVSLLLFLGLMFGVVCPGLISSDNTELVILGGLLIIITPVVACKWVKQILNGRKENEKI